MKVGLIVRFINGLYKDEEGLVYRIVEDNGDRVILEYICDLPIPPQSVALTEELEIVEDLDGNG